MKVEERTKKEKICADIERMTPSDDLQLTLAFTDQSLASLNIIDNTKAGIYIAENFNKDLVHESTGIQILAYQIRRNYSLFS